MSGPVNSILGTKIETIVDKFTLQTPQFFTVADGEVKVNGVIFDIDPSSAKINSIKRIKF